MIKRDREIAAWLEDRAVRTEVKLGVDGRERAQTLRAAADDLRAGLAVQDPAVAPAIGAAS